MTQQQYGYPPQGDPYQGQYQQAPPPQYGPPPGQYAPAPQYYQAPPPGYGPPQGQYGAQQAPPPPLVNASLDDFYNQPSSGGGPGLKFEQPGTRYLLRVSRAVTSGDVSQQTDKFQQPQTFRDGRPKLVMKVPALVLSGGDPRNHPDGTGVLYVKGQMRDELVRAMSEAGSQSAAPEHDALIDVLYANGRAIPGLETKQKIYQIRYYLPGTDPAAVLAGFAPSVQQSAPQYPQPGQPANYQLQQNPYQQPAQVNPNQGTAPVQYAPQPGQYQQTPQGYGTPQQDQYAPAPQAQAAYAGQPVAQQAYQAPQQAAQPQYPQGQTAPLPQGQGPAQQQPVQPQLPLPGQMSDEQRALLGRITNQPQQQG